MKALILREPGDFFMLEQPIPVPEDGEILLKVLRVGICGSDIHAFNGVQPFFEYPRIMGHEIAARIEAIPAGLKNGGTELKEGDLVTVLPYLHCGKCIACRNGKTNCCANMRVLGVHADGGLREYMTVPAFNVLKAKTLGLNELSLVECFSIGFHGVRRVNPKAGENALVVGAGPIGIGVVHGLKKRGANVIVMDINDGRLAYAKNTARADHVVNSLKENAAEALLRITGGENPSVVIDATGNADQMMRAFEYASSGGNIAYVGIVRQNLSFFDPAFHAKENTLFASRNATKEDFQDVISAIESREINTENFITHVAGSLEDAMANFSSWTKQDAACMKMTVEIA